MPVLRSQLFQPRARLDMAEVLATGIADPADTSLRISGLGVDPAAPGSPVSCSFTVSHSRPITGIELHAATETWTGVVVDQASGLVILFLSSVKTVLWNGQYTAVNLSSTALLAATEAGATLTVYAGPYEQFAGLRVGDEAPGSSAILSATVTAESAPDASLPQTPGSTTVATTGGGFWGSPWGTGVLVGGGIAAAVGVVWVAGHVAHSVHAREATGAYKASAVADFARAGVNPFAVA